MPPHPARSTGSHRLPPPPSASLRGRATVAAVAAGAVVAAGQTAVAAPFAEPPVAVATLTPVAEPRPLPAPVDAIGGDQPIAGLTVAALGPQDQVDVANLAKAVDIGEDLARKAAIIRAALSDGAPQAVLFGETPFVMPVLGRLTSAFGARWGTMHAGIDIANAIGTPIYALTDGVVEESGPASGFGLWVVLRHADGTQSVYGHINRSFVREGQRVRAGQQIAEVGNRGFSTGPHLHLEIWDADGNKLNPISWLNDRGIDL